MAVGFGALTLAAVVEITVFVLVVRWWGPPLTLLVMLATSVLGVLLLRHEGLRAWRRFREGLQAGEPPGVRVADGLVGLCGAVLLATPGLVGDVLGALLLVPPVRWLARRAVRRVAENRMPSPLAGDVFGPRRVRVRVDRSRAGSSPSGRTGSGPFDPAPSGVAGPGAPDAAEGIPGPVIEGEIIPPDRRD